MDDGFDTCCDGFGGIVHWHNDAGVDSVHDRSAWFGLDRSLMAAWFEQFHFEKTDS